MKCESDNPDFNFTAAQVDTENETMRMREGWKVWLLPNQATGKQGVPRYIKVDPSTISEIPPSEDAGEPDDLDQVGAFVVQTE